MTKAKDLKRPAFLLTSATHARELITIQYSLYQILNLLHGSLVRKEQKYRNLMAQNKYYVLPMINPDGLALIEEVFEDKHEILKKRKNQSPDAKRSNTYTQYECLPEDAGVDLNRNWGVSFNVSDQAYQVGLAKGTLSDDCGDPCGECYRGAEPFSEPETRAVRDFLVSHKDEIKFVSNTHSFGNMWIYPYNGEVHNTVTEKNPTQFLVFEEIINGAQFPDNNKNDGNSMDILGERIGGDMDDWVLQTLGIPSVTNELGDEHQFHREWEVVSREAARDIVLENSPWLEFTFEKIGS